MNHTQRLPSTGPARELLRVKGQFWTPDWVAETMAAYVLAGGSDTIFDPAVGAGSLFHAAKKIGASLGKAIKLSGIEIDSDALLQARQSGLSEDDIAHVQITDFALNPPRQRFKAIVANPPYIRHHRLSSDVKASLRKYGASLIGKPLDGRAGLHIYFLIRALDLLDEGGRLAFIMPADTCEGVFAQTLWRWITQKFQLEAVITFSSGASPFPTVDTNPIIFMIKNAPPHQHFFWAKCDRAPNDQLKEWTLSGFGGARQNGLIVYRREMDEALETGLSRLPSDAPASGPTLGDFVKVMRGIATGANEFFFLTTEQARALNIPDEFLISAIGRTRDLTSNEVTYDTLQSLERIGRPTLLFSPDGRPVESFSPSMRNYLKLGESKGIDKRILIATRRPWYKMESREVPPFLFAYLGRRSARFIRNLAGVMPLTGFLCVYPRKEDAAFVERLWRVLQHPETISNLRLVGKSYGSGAIKVEPRALERLPLPVQILAEVGLQLESQAAQLPFDF